MELATGNGTYLSTHASRVTGQGSYISKLRVTSTGAVTLELSRLNSAGAETVIQSATTISGLTYAVGDKLNVRTQVVGSSPATVRARVWKVGSIEPTTRAIGPRTAGLGLMWLGSARATNGPITVSVDQLVATATP